MASLSSKDEIDTRIGEVQDLRDLTFTPQMFFKTIIQHLTTIGMPASEIWNSGPFA